MCFDYEIYYLRKKKIELKENELIEMYENQKSDL